MKDFKTDKNKEEKKSYILSRIFIFILIFFCVATIIYLRFWDFFVELYIELGWMAFLFSSLATICIIAAIIFFRYSKETKFKPLIIFLGVSIFLIFLFSWSLLETFSFKSLIVIIIFSFFFGYLCAFPKHFLSEFTNSFGKNIGRIGFYIIFKLFIPMLFVYILLLGAIHGKYQYESTFLLDSKTSLNTASGYITNAFYELIEPIYLLGESRPNFYFFIF
jgi:hypothetical protein